MFVVRGALSAVRAAAARAPHVFGAAPRALAAAAGPALPRKRSATGSGGAAAATAAAAPAAPKAAAAAADPDAALYDISVELRYDSDGELLLDDTPELPVPAEWRDPADEEGADDDSALLGLASGETDSAAQAQYEQLLARYRRLRTAIDERQASADASGKVDFALFDQRLKLEEIRTTLAKVRPRGADDELVPLRSVLEGESISEEDVQRLLAEAESAREHFEKTLGDLKRAVESGDAFSALIDPAKLDASSRIYATGRRKTSVARVWLRQGEGAIVVNNRPFVHFFPRPTTRLHVLEPFDVSNTLCMFDVHATTSGGGLTGQAGALRLGIARALADLIPNLQPVMREAGLLTRDARMVERKKPGRHKARKRPQWSKR